MTERVEPPRQMTGAAVNMGVGVTQAGDTVAKEFPVFPVVFAGPAAVALVVHWHGRSG